MPPGDKNVLLAGPLALKLGRLPQVERELLERHPRVFIPGFQLGNLRVMRRGAPTTPEHLVTGLVLLRDNLWGREAQPRLDWKEKLLLHLWQVFPSRELERRVIDLPERASQVDIHGDATSANLLLYRGRVSWIDPQVRSYLPGFPAVDVAKTWQSATGYERVLVGENPSFDEDLAGRLLDVGRPYTDWQEVETWWLIHLVRLLRYHTPTVAGKFREVLRRYACVA